MKIGLKFLKVWISKFKIGVRVLFLSVSVVLFKTFYVIPRLALFRKVKGGRVLGVKWFGIGADVIIHKRMFG